MEKEKFCSENTILCRYHDDNTIAANRKWVMSSKLKDYNHSGISFLRLSSFNDIRYFNDPRDSFLLYFFACSYKERNSGKSEISSVPECRRRNGDACAACRAMRDSCTRFLYLTLKS